MPTPRVRVRKRIPEVAKTPTGIAGFDEITRGGVPRGRTSLVTGAAGAGKTLFGMQFVYRGATEFGEPGVFMTFEESEREVAENVASLGFDLSRLIKRRMAVLDFVRVERSEIEETGEYDLEGLFVRLGHAIDQIKAKRVVLDTIEALFAALPNDAILRAELRRLFRWLKSRGVTAIITAERGEGTFTRHGLEEYVSDCVVQLDHRVAEQVSTRRMRVIKYRGSTHGTNEYPFLIDNEGISLMPITSPGLKHKVSTARISTGIARLDEMLSRRGYFRGSSVLVSGSAGSGKTSVAAHFVAAACARGERCLFLSYEESEAQLIRNMRSIGVDLRAARQQRLLRFFPSRPQLHGLEAHLAFAMMQIAQFRPAVVVVDPVTSLIEIGGPSEARAMLARLLDFIKSRGITALFASLTPDVDNPELTQVGISSLMDTWLLLRNVEIKGERKRGLYILKSRGMAHSNRIHDFILTKRGLELVDAALSNKQRGAGKGADDGRDRRLAR